MSDWHLGTILLIAAPVASVVAAVATITLAIRNQPSRRDVTREYSPATRWHVLAHRGITSDSPKNQSPGSVFDNPAKLSWNLSRRPFLYTATRTGAAIAASVVAILLTLTLSGLPKKQALTEAGSEVPLRGGCPTFQLFAQSQIKPYGAIAYTSPDSTTHQVHSFYPNYVVVVDGWTFGAAVSQGAHATAPKHSTEPNQPRRGRHATNLSRVWFHLEGGGWVSALALRSEPTKPDTPISLGIAAPATPACYGTASGE